MNQLQMAKMLTVGCSLLVNGIIWALWSAGKFETYDTLCQIGFWLVPTLLPLCLASGAFYIGGVCEGLKTTLISFLLLGVVGLMGAGIGGVWEEPYMKRVLYGESYPLHMPMLAGFCLSACVVTFLIAHDLTRSRRER